MKKPFFQPTQTSEGWQVFFAFRVSHRFADDWLKMKWGFNASVLLEEAMDRVKLFIETQTFPELDFRAGISPNRTLALRGINFPGQGLQMALVGKVAATNREEAEQLADQYAREIHSIYPHDFILTAGDEAEFHLLFGNDILNNNSNVAQILRSIVVIPSVQGNHFLTGLWQSSTRANEQIWRALGAMPDKTMFNVMLQPSPLFDGDRQILLDIKKQISNSDNEGDNLSTYKSWADTYIKRRISAWKKFFKLQLHVISMGALDENLLRSIGSAVTRDSSELASPGYLVRRPDIHADKEEWLERVKSLEFIPSLSRFDDIADMDEVSAIFRLPYQPETGLPGAVFIDAAQTPAKSIRNGE